MDKESLKNIGFIGRGRTLHRNINDLVQLVNFQPSNYSDEEYINIAIWPSSLGNPTTLLEHKFPIRGRIEDYVGETLDRAEGITQLVSLLDGPLATLSGLKLLRSDGRLRNIYLSAAARGVLDG